MRNIFLLILFLPQLLSAQSDSIQREKNNGRLFLLSVGYRTLILQSKIINSGNGAFFEAGFNLGKFFSEKTTMGIYAGWGFQDRLWNTSFAKEFRHDYNKALSTERIGSHLDSAIIRQSEKLIQNETGRAPLQPGCETSSFHNYALYYGIIFRAPFEHAPLIKLYKGTTRSHFQGDYKLVTGKGDYNIFQLRREMYGAEISYLFNIRKNGIKTQNHIGISIYGELANFYNSELYFDDGEQSRKLQPKNFTSAHFLSKYKNETTLGAKIFFALM